ncbi:MAG: DUF4349 domain-containing protein [Gemmatimonadaceae bacterium]
MKSFTQASAHPPETSRTRSLTTCFALIAFLGLLASCGQNVNAPNKEMQLAATAVPQLQLQGGAAGVPVQPALEQKLIRTGELQLEVSDAQKVMLRVDSVTKSKGGQVADSRVTQDASNKYTAVLVVNVPSSKFEDAVSAISQLGDVQNRAMSSEDVTKRYFDLQTRLSVKEQSLTRLRALLDGRAAKLADVLEVEREIDRAVEELEQLKGEQKFYDQQIAMSKITITLTEQGAATTSQFSTPIVTAIRKSYETLGTSLAAIIYLISFLLPWALVLGAIWFLLKRYYLKKTAASKPPNAPPETKS